MLRRKYHLFSASLVFTMLISASVPQMTLNVNAEEEISSTSQTGSISPVTSRDVIYQIITDRFCDGDHYSLHLRYLLFLYGLAGNRRGKPVGRLCQLCRYLPGTGLPAFLPGDAAVHGAEYHHGECGCVHYFPAGNQ